MRKKAEETLEMSEEDEDQILMEMALEAGALTQQASIPWEEVDPSE